MSREDRGNTIQYPPDLPIPSTLPNMQELDLLQLFTSGGTGGEYFVGHVISPIRPGGPSYTRPTTLNRTSRSEIHYRHSVATPHLSLGPNL